MSKQEKNIVNSIANKLEIVLYKNKITILGLSKLLAVDKQLLYRIMKREHIPNILFLELIADYLNCTILELIDEKFFLDINVYEKLDIINKNKYKNYRVYIYDNDFMNIVNNEFFGIIKSLDIKIFYKVNKILQDGYYLLRENDNILKEINIISVGTNLIIALINNKEIRLNPN
ncbi:MAG TPA: helix-turn-helix transcriptional regulator, partial [Burkholderiales bacterium]|nr:helix-turn-helix transcriptional regulator [Burkholderiales bacterium]